MVSPVEAFQEADSQEADSAPRVSIVLHHTLHGVILHLHGVHHPHHIHHHTRPRIIPLPRRSTIPQEKDPSVKDLMVPRLNRDHQYRDADEELITQAQADAKTMILFSI